jgi:hypothetical protein
MLYHGGVIFRVTILRLRALNRGFTLVRSTLQGPDEPDKGYWVVPLGGSEPVSEHAMTLDEVRQYLRDYDEGKVD